jgi:polysaccharide biosynthesis/export protein
LAIGLLFKNYGQRMRTLSAILRVVTVVILGSAMLHSQDIATTSEHKSTHVGGTNPAGSNTPVADSAATTSQFILGSADVIHIGVWKNPDITQTVTISPDGFISLPLLGDVHVAGMTPNQLAQDLKTKLSNYMTNAQVTISIVEIHSRQVFVTGQVGKPGGYPLVAPISVLQLIAQAGGLNTFANRKDIVILRGAGSQLQRLKFNYKDAVRGDPKQNISLQPGDTVIVP